MNVAKGNIHSPEQREPRVIIFLSAEEADTLVKWQEKVLRIQAVLSLIPSLSQFVQHWQVPFSASVS